MTFTFKDWNAQQKELREALESPSKFDQAIDLVFLQHGWTHQGQVSDIDKPTFADQLWEGLDQEFIRIIPPGGEHSIAWCIYHLSRIEDTAVSVLLAEVPMLLDQADWEARLKVPCRDTCNEMPPADIRDLSEEIDFDALKEYRAAVGKRTREFIHALTWEQLKVRVDPGQIQQILDLGAVRPEAAGLLEYWGKRTIQGLLLMPVTRHNMVHINEALRIKTKLLRRKG